VTATVGENNPQLFSGLQGHTMGQVQAVATAEVVQLPLPACIYALNQTNTQDEVVVSGGGQISSPDCGIVDNSSNSKALETNGGGTIKVGFIKIVGGFNSTGNSTISPTPTTGIPAVSDPLASLPAPTATTPCAYTNLSLSGGTTQLYGGTYCGGIKISGGAVVNFNPGVYYIYGGGFTVSGGSGAVTSSTTGGNGSGGVMFFNTDGHGNSGLATSTNYGVVSFTGGLSVSLSAPTSGTYSGILFFKDRLVTASNNSDVISGNTKPILSGTLYFPGENLTFSGSAGLGAYTASNSPAIVVGSFTVTGSAFDIQNGTGSTSQFKFATLVQ
jgi:hypothetical protein